MTSLYDRAMVSMGTRAQRFLGFEVSVHEADDQGQPQTAKDGPDITVIRQYHRQGDVNAYQSLYREAVSLMTRDPGDAAQGKFVLIDDEHWFIANLNPIGWGWWLLSVTRGDC